MSSANITIKSKTRIWPRLTKKAGCTVVPLSLLDATTSSFALTSAIWLFDRPALDTYQDGFDLPDHLHRSLVTALNAYPHWAGQIRAIQIVDGSGPSEASNFPAHARRFGRIYARFGDEDDPGVDLAIATSTATADELHPSTRTERQASWDGQSTGLHHYTSLAKIADPFQPDAKDEEDMCKPVMAIQATELACGGFVLAIKLAHPLADITALVNFVKHWAKTSQTMLNGLQGDATPEACPLFDPAKLDAFATGDINCQSPDPAVLQHVTELPMHRYDWWQSAADCPWPVAIPPPFRGNEPIVAGTRMPFSEWDIGAPVSHHIIHFTKPQVQLLSSAANRESVQKLSQHDALLGHVWSCIARSRNLGHDTGPIHCDLVYGARPALQLGANFVGSPTIMINIELPGAEVAGKADANESMAHLGRVGRRVRETIGQMALPENIAKHLHSVAYESTPQRIWQAFLGRRHILVTTWARAGVYDIDFGLGSPIRYVDGVVPDMDGLIVIKEAPPKAAGAVASSSWTENGVDVSIRLRTEDMQRLLADPLLFPKSGS